MIRKTLKDWTLSDGTHIPTDNIIAIASGPMHKDEVGVLYIHAVKHTIMIELSRRYSLMPTLSKHSDGQKCATQKCVTETESWIASTNWFL